MKNRYFLFFFLVLSLCGKSSLNGMEGVKQFAIENSGKIILACGLGVTGILGTAGVIIFYRRTKTKPTDSETKKYDFTQLKELYERKRKYRHEIYLNLLSQLEKQNGILQEYINAPSYSKKINKQFKKNIKDCFLLSKEHKRAIYESVKNEKYKEIQKIDPATNVLFCALKDVDDKILTLVDNQGGVRRYPKGWGEDVQTWFKECFVNELDGLLLYHLGGKENFKIHLVKTFKNTKEFLTKLKRLPKEERQKIGRKKAIKKFTGTNTLAVLIDCFINKKIDIDIIENANVLYSEMYGEIGGGGAKGSSNQEESSYLSESIRSFFSSHSRSCNFEFFSDSENNVGLVNK